VIEGPARSALGNLLPFNRKEWRLALEVVHLTADHGSRPREVKAMMFACPNGGDALEHDFGIGNHDLVLWSNLVHHFSAIQNAKLIQRLARSLRPHGVLTATEPIRSEETTSVDQFAGLNELYFGMTSRSEMWRAPEIAQWQRQAGLKAADGADHVERRLPRRSAGDQVGQR
jgi:SAM-dependent methyltransferase